MRAAALLAAWLAAPASALEVSPMYGVQVLGGQYFFRGERGSLSGNASAVVAPAMKVNERWAVLPTLQASYQGTKQVVDLVGAGSLFQEQMDHRVGAKAVYLAGDGRWRLKPSLGFRYQLLKETRDEDWTKGLFDYYKYGAGFEAEYVYKDPFSVRLGADYYHVAFPNYESLESQAASQGLARELSGTKTLDSRNVALSASASAPLAGRLVVEGSLLGLYGRYPEQRVVDAAGALTDPVREDVTVSAVVGAKMPTELNSDLRTLGGLDVTFTAASSNQNGFDAANAQYTPLFYNYRELRLSPSFKLLIGPARQPIVAGLAVHLWRRQYTHRLAQDSSGVYQGDTIHQDNWMTSASLTYPMAPRFNLVFNVQHGRSASNNTYEQFYRYTYSVTNYLFGFSFDY